MPSRRQEQVAEQIQRELGDMLLRSTNDPRIGFASVTTVQVSADLRHAKVFVSVLGTEHERKETMTALRHATGYLRRELAARISFKFVPDLAFISDGSIEQGDRMLRLIEQVRSDDRSRDETQ